MGLRMWAFGAGVLLFMLPAVAVAETVTLRNGETLVGPILSQNAHSVTIRVNGQTRTILKTNVRRITYDDGRPAFLPKTTSTPKTSDKKQSPAVQSSHPAQTSLPGNRQALLWRSAVLPGWGQHKDGRRIAGYVWGAGFGIAVLGAAEQSSNISTKRRAYESVVTGTLVTSPTLLSSQSGGVFSTNQAIAQLFMAGQVSTQSRRAWKESATRGRHLALAAGCIYAANIVDVLWRPSGGSAIFVGTQNQNLAVGMRVSF